MTSYVNPLHGNDATAQHGSRAHPWRSYPVAEAALKQLRDEALQRDPHHPGVYKLVLTHKPLPPPNKEIIDNG